MAEGNVTYGPTGGVAAPSGMRLAALEKVGVSKAGLGKLGVTRESPVAKASRYRQPGPYRNRYGREASPQKRGRLFGPSPGGPEYRNKLVT